MLKFGCRKFRRREMKRFKSSSSASRSTRKLDGSLKDIMLVKMLHKIKPLLPLLEFGKGGSVTGAEAVS